MIKQNETPINVISDDCYVPLKGNSRKKKRIEYPLNQNQICELSNISSQSRVGKYISKNHLLIKIISNRGLFVPHTLIGFYPESIQNVIKAQYSLPSDIHFISCQETKQKHPEICYQAQHLFLGNILKAHNEYMNILKAENSNQKSQMNGIELDITSCNCKSHFRYYLSKRKKKSLSKSKNFSKLNKNLIIKPQSERESVEETGSLEDSNQHSEVMLIKKEDCSESNIVGDMDSLEEGMNNCGFKMFENSDLKPFVPDTFRDDLSFCL